MKIKLSSLFTCVIFFSLSALSQGIAINENGNNADPSAILDLESTSKGFLLPRMSETQRNGILSPAAGLTIFNTSINKTETFDGVNWISIGNSTELKVDYKSTNFSIGSSQDNTLFIVDNLAVAQLPSLTNVPDGFRVYIKRTGFSAVNAAAVNGELIEGVPNVGIGFQGGVLEIVATATQWELLRVGTVGTNANTNACPTGSVSYTNPGQSSFTVTQVMVDYCIFSIELKGGAGGGLGGGNGGGIAFNFEPSIPGTLGVFVGGGGTTSGSGGAGGGATGAGGGGGGATAVNFNSSVLAIAGGGGGARDINNVGGDGGANGAGLNGTGTDPGGGAPGNGSGGIRTSTNAGNGGSAGNNGGNGNLPGGAGNSAFGIGGGGGSRSFGSGGGGGGGYGGGAGGAQAGGGGGAGFISNDPSISNGTTISGTPSANSTVGVNGSVIITISPK